MTTILEATDLTKTYGSGDSAVEALRGVSLTIFQGDFVAIMGPSGCGKSTLINMLAGLDQPTSGEVTIAGRRIDQMSESQLARLRRAKIGFMFQSFNLIPTLSAGENVELVLRLNGTRRRKARRMATELLARVGVESKRDTAPALLSGGEQQRVALARAIANSPEVVFADEPTGNLDSTATREVLSLLKKARNEGQTLVVVTHDARVAAAADRVVTMRDGAIVDQTKLGVVRASTELSEWSGAQ